DAVDIDELNLYRLLGGEAAGNTTFMDLLAGHRWPTGRDVYVNSERPVDNPYIVEPIGVTKHAHNINREQKLKHVLHTYSLFYPNWDEALANTLVQEYKLPIQAKVKALSKGMESALGVIVGLASNAFITIFDEPYIGLDAAVRKKFYDMLLEQYEERPRTIIFSTHLIDEVSLLFE